MTIADDKLAEIRRISAQIVRFPDIVRRHREGDELAKHAMLLAVKLRSFDDELAEGGELPSSWAIRPKTT